MACPIKAKNIYSFLVANVHFYVLKRQYLNREISLAARRVTFERSVQGLLVFGLTRCSISFDTLTEEKL